jgi:hypothetical protein
MAAERQQDNMNVETLSSKTTKLDACLKMKPQDASDDTSSSEQHMSELSSLPMEPEENSFYFPTSDFLPAVEENLTIITNRSEMKEALRSLMRSLLVCVLDEKKGGKLSQPESVRKDGKDLTASEWENGDTTRTDLPAAWDSIKETEAESMKESLEANKEANASGKEPNAQDTEDKGDEEDKDEPQDLFDEEAVEKSELETSEKQEFEDSEKLACGSNRVGNVEEDMKACLGTFTDFVLQEMNSCMKKLDQQESTHGTEELERGDRQSLKLANVLQVEEKLNEDLHLSIPKSGISGALFNDDAACPYVEYDRSTAAKNASLVSAPAAKKSRGRQLQSVINPRQMTRYTDPKRTVRKKNSITRGSKKKDQLHGNAFVSYATVDNVDDKPSKHSLECHTLISTRLPDKHQLVKTKMRKSKMLRKDARSYLMNPGIYCKMTGDQGMQRNGKEKLARCCRKMFFPMIRRPCPQEICGGHFPESPKKLDVRRVLARIRKTSDRDGGGTAGQGNNSVVGFLFFFILVSFVVLRRSCSSFGW